MTSEIPLAWRVQRVPHAALGLSFDPVWNYQIDYYTNFTIKTEYECYAPALYFLFTNNYSAIVVDRNSCLFASLRWNLHFQFSYSTKWSIISKTAPHFQLADWIYSSLFPSLFFSPVEHSMDFLFVSLLSFGVWWVRSFALRLRYVMAMLYGIIWIYVRLSLSLSLCEFVVVVDSNKKCISVTKSNKTSQLIWRYCCFSFIRFFSCV